MDLRCPKCKSIDIEDDDSFDITFNRFKVTEYIAAHCVECGTNITYERVYEFVDIENVQLD